MQYVNDKSRSVRQFDSLAECAKYIEATKPSWPYKESRTAKRSNTWDLRAGYDKAWEMARYGWPEGAQEATKALKVFQPKEPKPDLRTDFYGHMPHVARYCAGAPDSMIRHARQGETGSGKVLTLYVCTSANCGQSAVSMSNYGLAIAQYINQMETDGTRIEIHAVIQTTIYSKPQSFTIRIKRADQPLDLAVLAYAIGHPAMFRRIGFALIERSDARPTPGYGHAGNINATHAINPPHGAVFLNGMLNAYTNAPTPEKALEKLIVEIERAREAQ